jgi:hypothetical protein
VYLLLVLLCKPGSLCPCQLVLVEVALTYLCQGWATTLQQLLPRLLCEA